MQEEDIGGAEEAVVYGKGKPNTRSLSKAFLRYYNNLISFMSQNTLGYIERSK